MKYLNYFSKGEWTLWLSSLVLIVTSFYIYDGVSYLTLTASLIGVTSLIFNAKGNPFGQFLMILFSLLYGVISYSFSYYGEMLTYLGMTMPMAVFAMIAWLRNPYNGRKTEVRVNRLSIREYVLMVLLTIVVTAFFGWILWLCHTTHLFFSTVSVTTSFLAVYLTYRRSPYFALAYAANDVVLIILWTMASFQQSSYISVVICFAVFLLNDFYGYLNWSKMQKNQELAAV